MSLASVSFFVNNVQSMNERDLDLLPYGVIQLDTEGRVLRYNKHEAGLSGLPQAEVVGKNFFKQVAPCTDIKEFYGRFREGIDADELHCTFRFHFAFENKPRDVTVTLLYNARDQTVWVLVQTVELGE
jgi:photoactive yellow protein